MVEKAIIIHGIRKEKNMQFKQLKDIREANRRILEGAELAIIAGGDILQLNKKHLDFADEPTLTTKNIKEMFRQWCGVYVRWGWKYYEVS